MRAAPALSGDRQCQPLCQHTVSTHARTPLAHIDVKPSNIFLDGAGHARLGDFGLARLLPASAATLTGETGTYLYMAPEMIR